MFLPLVLFAQDKQVAQPKKEMKEEMKKEVSVEQAQATAEAQVDVMKIRGYVVDAMCAKGMMKNSETSMKKAMAHSKECALDEQCTASGYGLMSDGKWYKFDEKGDALAKESISSSKTEKGLMYEVTGKMEGDKFVVASLNEKMSEKADKKMDKKSEMKEEKSKHKH